jgi:hypothetical protein
LDPILRGGFADEADLGNTQSREYNHIMEQISPQLVYQRLRNRVIELMEMHFTAEDAAALGAFELVNMVDDWFPLTYDAAPKVFNAKEKDAISDFLRQAAVAADATVIDTWDAEWFKNSPEWSALFKVAQEVHAILMQRGRFSEDEEETLPM